MIEIYHRNKEGDRFERYMPLVNPNLYAGCWAAFVADEANRTGRRGEYLMIAEDRAYLYQAEPERPKPPIRVVRI